MEYIKKPSIVKLSRRAGVKSLSDDCYDNIRKIIETKLDDVIKTVLIVNSEHNTKTIMVNDIYDALHLMKHNVTKSDEVLGIK